jgi:antitoxin VapB
MSSQRRVRLFRNGRNQAVRLPREFEFPGEEAMMHKEGDRLILEPARPTSLLAVLELLEPLEETFPEIEDPSPEAVDL